MWLALAARSLKEKAAAQLESLGFTFETTLADRVPQRTSAAGDLSQTAGRCPVPRRGPAIAMAARRHA